jgi:hypothetical protein
VKVVNVDLTQGRERRRKPVIQCLLRLQHGKAYVHDHTPYTTPFSAWIAIQRSRLEKNFTYTKLQGNFYEISVAPENPTETT